MRFDHKPLTPAAVYGFVLVAIDMSLVYFARLLLGWKIEVLDLILIESGVLLSLGGLTELYSSLYVGKMREATTSHEDWSWSSYVVKTRTARILVAVGALFLIVVLCNALLCGLS